MIRAIWEVGFDFWSPAPRGDVLVPLGVWLLLPLITSHLMANRRAAGMALATVSTLAIVVLGIP